MSLWVTWEAGVELEFSNSHHSQEPSLPHTCGSGCKHLASAPASCLPACCHAPSHDGCASLMKLSNFIGSGTIRRYGFVGVGMAFLDKVCHYGVDLEVSYAQDTA